MLLITANACQAAMPRYLGADPVSTGVVGGRISEPWTLNHVKTGKKSN